MSTAPKLSILVDSTAEASGKWSVMPPILQLWTEVNGEGLSSTSLGLSSLRLILSHHVYLSCSLLDGPLSFNVILTRQCRN